MKSFKTFITETKFSIMNFPSEVGDNSSFGKPGKTGSRTIYAPVNTTDYGFPEGFPMAKNAKMYKKDGTVAKELKKDDTVHFTAPSKLVTAKDLGITGRDARGTFAPVSLSGFDKKVDGYVIISAVAKPSGNNQGRVGSGSKAQDVIALKIKEMCHDKDIEVDNDYSTAIAASTKPDLVMTIAGKRVQFEIKNQTSPTALITLFDKTGRRTGREAKELGLAADAYYDKLKVDGKTLSSLMKAGGFKKTFTGVMDYFRSVNPKIGFVGDSGVIKSGKLPPELKTVDRSLLSKFEAIIKDHFKEGGDDYLCIYNSKRKTFDLYYLNAGTSDNVLGAPNFPQLSMFQLATYGGRSGDGTRCGFKIKLKK